METTEVGAAPQEIDTSKLAVGVSKKVEQLKQALQIIDEMESPQIGLLRIRI